MEEYTLYTDFENYVKENGNLITYLDDHQSLLNEYVSPIIKSLTYLNHLIKEEEGSKEDMKEVFEFGFHLLFENIEQLKLYLRQLNNDYKLLEKMSLYIRVVFDLEELKIEIERSEAIDSEDKKQDVKQIEEALEFFEENIVPQAIINEFELDKYLQLYYDLIDKYPNLVLISEAFDEYCAVYGI